MACCACQGHDRLLGAARTRNDQLEPSLGLTARVRRTKRAAPRGAIRVVPVNAPTPLISPRWQACGIEPRLLLGVRRGANAARVHHSYDGQTIEATEAERDLSN